MTERRTDYRTQEIAAAVSPREKDAILVASGRYGCDSVAQLIREALFDFLREADLDPPNTLLE